MQKKGPVYRSPALFHIGRILGLIMVSCTLRVTLVIRSKLGGWCGEASGNLTLYAKWWKRLDKAGNKNVSFLLFDTSGEVCSF